MSIRVLARYCAIIPIWLLAACSTLPPALPDENELPLSRAIAFIQCELRDGFLTAEQSGKRSWLLDWEVAYKLTLNVTDSGALKLAGGSPLTFTNVSTAIGADITVTRTKKRIAVLNFKSTAREIVAQRCDIEPIVGGHPFVSGNVGVAEWLTRSLDAVDHAGIKHTNSTSVGHTFEFIVKVDANASAGFSFLPAGGASITPSIVADRMDDHTLDLTMSPQDITKRAVDVTRTVTKPGRPLTKQEVEKTAELTKTLSDLRSEIVTMDANSPAARVRRQRMEKLEKEIDNINSVQRPSTETQIRRQIVTERGPGQSQNLLLQLQLERLLTPRF